LGQLPRPLPKFFTLMMATTKFAKTMKNLNIRPLIHRF
jgi:hypothetical protein